MRGWSPALAAFAVAALALALACGGGEPEPTPTAGGPTSPAPTETPLVVEGTAVVPSGGAGVPALDSLIAAIRSRDREALRQFIGSRQVACTRDPQGLGAPPRCEGGEEDGTLVDAFLFASCEGEYLRPPAIDRALNVLAAANVYAVYGVAGDERYQADYSVVMYLGSPEDATAWEAVVDEGRVVVLLFSCAQAPAELVETRGLQDAVLGP